MKPRFLLLALLLGLESGCSTTGQQPLQVQPLMTIRHGASDPQAYYQLGRYYQGQRRLEQAEEAYLKAITIDERHLEALNALAALYAQRGEMDRSLELFERIAAMAPKAPHIQNNLGFAYYLSGRLEKAYAAVRTALDLDGKLERGWANLDLIASKLSDPRLSEAARSRQLQKLPQDLADGASALQPSHSDAAVTAAMMPAPPEPQKEAGGGNGPMGRQFVLSFADREVVPHDGVIELAQSKSDRNEDGRRGRENMRVEISNANGVTGFAKKFSDRLRNDVSSIRITNYRTYLLNNTVVHYQAGYEPQARALMNEIGLTALLVPARIPRPGSDIRIVLGRDLLPG